jgi:hypothetical protein
MFIFLIKKNKLYGKIAFLFFMPIVAWGQEINMSEYFPLEPQDDWTYQMNQETDEIIRFVETQTVNLNNTQTYTIIDDAALFSDNYSNDSNGLHWHRFTEPTSMVGSSDIYTFMPAIQLAAETVLIGDSFNSNGIAEVDFPEFSEPEEFNYSATSTILGMESVTVPLGTFTAVKISYVYSLSDELGTFFTETNTIWLVKHFGIVKSEKEIEGNTDITELIELFIDHDQDSLNVTEDNCPEISNINQENWDGDVEGDVCDNDDDNDGLPDDYEISFNFDPFDDTDADMDNDNDGLTNLEEFLAGRNPVLNEAAIILLILSSQD